MVRTRPIYADSQLVVEQLPPGGELRFTGEIDGRNAPAVTRSIFGALNSRSDLHLDLSAAEFRDGTGLDALLVAAGSLRSGRLVLHGLPPLIEAAIRAVACGRSEKLAIRVGGPRMR